MRDPGIPKKNKNVKNKQNPSENNKKFSRRFYLFNKSN